MFSFREGLKVADLTLLKQQKQQTLNLDRTALSRNSPDIGLPDRSTTIREPDLKIPNRNRTTPNYD